MSIIAVAGKGGVGKTSLSGLLVRHLAAEDPPVLAIDADPNSNLAEKLGLEPRTDISAALDTLREATEGVSKHDLMLAKAREAIIEGKDLDVLSMGRPQGRGCYCFANSVLRDILNLIVSDYRHTLIDNEAGMEHLSRGTVERVDVLLVVSDPTAPGLRTAMRIMSLARELEVDADRTVLVVNSVPERGREALRRRLHDLGVYDFNLIPYDEELMRRNMDGNPICDMHGSPADKAVARLAARLSS